MSDTKHVVGATSKNVRLEAIQISTGLPYTAGLYTTATISATYTRDGSSPVAITPLVAGSVGSYVANGFVHRGKGTYLLGAPDAAFLTGADGVEFEIDGIPDVLFKKCRVELDSVNPRDIPAGVRTNLTTELGRVDAAVSTRLATAGYTAPDNTSVGTILTDTTNIKTRLPAALTANGNMKSSVVEWITTLLTEGAAGRFIAGLKQFFDIATPTSTMNTVTAVTTVATTTNVTNAPTAGDLTATMKASVTSAVPTAAQNASAANDAAIAALKTYSRTSDTAAQINNSGGPVSLTLTTDATYKPIKSAT